MIIRKLHTMNKSNSKHEDKIPSILDFGMFIIQNNTDHNKSNSNEEHVLNGYYIMPKYSYTFR
jgi:hypothetical protein